MFISVVIVGKLVFIGCCSDVFLDTEFDGEAQNPGPDDIRLGLCNPTSLANKVPTFRDLNQQFQCQFISASETSATLPTQAIVARNLKSLGYFSAFTPPAPSLRARQDQQVSLRGKATGRAKPVDPGIDLRLTRVIVDDWKMQIITVYGLAQSHAGAQDFNNELLALAAQGVRQVNLPAIILGGFNAEVCKLAASSTLTRVVFCAYSSSAPP